MGGVSCILKRVLCTRGVTQIEKDVGFKISRCCDEYRIRITGGKALDERFSGRVIAGYMQVHGAEVVGVIGQHIAGLLCLAQRGGCVRVAFVLLICKAE